MNKKITRAAKRAYLCQGKREVRIPSLDNLKDLISFSREMNQIVGKCPVSQW